MDGISLKAFGVFAPNGAFGSIFGVGGSDEGAEIRHGVFFAHNGSHDGAGTHEIHQAFEKGFALMNGVKSFGLFPGHAGKFHRYNVKTAFENVSQNPAGKPCFYSAGLDHGECVIPVHGYVYLVRVDFAANLMLFFMPHAFRGFKKIPYV